MRIDQVVYLNSSGARVYGWDGRTPQLLVGHGATTGDIVEYLAGSPDRVTAILVDVPDEEHSRESLPRLRGADQRAVIARRLGRVYGRTPYRVATPLGRSADKQSDQFLFSALTRPEPVRELLTGLNGRRLPVSGVFSPALLATPITEALQIAATPTLLVTRQGDGSLRHSFYQNRQFAGSRVLRASAAAQPGDELRMQRQLEESVRYFDPALAPSRANPIDVLIVDDPALPTAGTESLKVRNVDVRELGARLGLETPCPAGQCEQLFVELVRQSRGTGNFAPAADRRYFQHHQIKRFGRAASFVATAAAIAGIAINTTAWLDLQSRDRAGQSTMEQLRLALDLSDAHSPADPADPLTMARVVSAYDTLANQSADPATILTTISRALAGQPGVRIDAIKWTTGQAPAVDEAASVAEVPAAESAPADATTPSDGADGAAPPEPGQVRVMLTGRIEPFAGNYRAALVALDRFIGALSVTPGVSQVTPLVRPLDTRTSTTLTGEITTASNGAEAGFTLAVTLTTRSERVAAGTTDGPA